MLIALDAVLHVMISHGFAIGAISMIVLAESIGMRQENIDWDIFARRFLTALIIIVTGIGAPTGVGIWLITSAVTPKGIGSLLRVFFWPWFIEWLVFTIEVILLLLYYFTWERWRRERKRLHLKIGIAYLACALASAVLITGILGFMITPDSWPVRRDFIGAYFNATFLPQLSVRLGIAITLGALFATTFAAFSHTADGIRLAALRLYGRIALVGFCWTTASSIWYMAMIPSSYTAHIPFALLTSHFSDRPSILGNVMAAIATTIILYVLAASRGPLIVVRILSVPTIVMALFYVVAFERAREFIRGPYLMPGYLYANQLLLSESHLSRKEGLSNSTPWYQTLAVGDPEARGAFLFAQNCTACHTLRGVNGIVQRVKGRPEDGIVVMLGHLNEMVPFMPPFSGNDEERHILARYLADLPIKGDDPSRYSPYWRKSP